MTVKLPVKKCYYVIKVVILLGLVVSVLSLFEFWRGGGRNILAVGDEDEFDLEQQVRGDEARIVPGLGEGGEAALLIGTDLKKGELSEKKYAMNVYLSDRISYNRTLKDYRNPACTRVLYDAELPSVSVVIVFHNEPYSALLRTVWSVINSVRRDLPCYKRARYRKGMKLGYRGQRSDSPYLYLKEIILVDDNSTLPELKDRLSHYVRTRLPAQLVRILRLPDRWGLMRARVHGARTSRGDVLVFLDAHCEVGWDWLRPLLQRLATQPHAALTPMIDVLHHDTFRIEPADLQVGGFTFAGHFTWIEVPEREKKRRGSDISPTWSPTMAGGLFAISRDYFWQLGAYDEQMAGWGGENLELSFRIWQCGGTLETVPCSRVGHVFRSFHPYGLPAASDTHGINTARMAEVWMDDYKELFYLHRPDLRNSPKIGDVTHRKILREKLQCKSFSWYLTHIYRDKFVPVRDVIAFGRFRHIATGLCLDSMQSDQDAAPLGLYPCHDALQASQYYSLSLKGELRDEERCAEVEFARESGDHHPIQRRVVMLACHGKRRSQRWRLLSSGRIQHVESRLCLYAPEGGVAMATNCDADTATLKWDIDYNEENHFALDKNNPTEQELKLRSLRGQKRVSRSLLSHSKPKHPKHHHKHHRKSPRRPRFLLLVSHPGGTEHLHLEATCPHRTLRRNDTLMREVVTALTKYNLQVENSNRLFVGDRVVKLPPTSSPNKHIIIEDFVELPDTQPDTRTIDKNDSSNDVNGHEQTVKMRADDKQQKLNDSKEVIHRSNTIRPSGSGVSLMLKTNLNFHLDDDFFWKRDKDPSSRENMSLLRTLSPPIPTLPPSDIEDNKQAQIDNENNKQTEIDNETEPDKKIEREVDLKSELEEETNIIADSDTNMKLHETDYKTDTDIDKETDINSDTDMQSDKETNKITDSDSDIKSDIEGVTDYITDSETDIKSETDTDVKLKRIINKKDLLGKRIKLTKTDSKTESDSERNTKMESDRNTKTGSDRKSGSESDRKSGPESDRKSGSESERKTVSDGERRTDSESERRTGSESDRKTDSNSDRKMKIENDRKTDIETDFSNSIEVNDKKTKSKLDKDYSDYDHS